MADTEGKTADEDKSETMKYLFKLRDDRNERSGIWYRIDHNVKYFMTSNDQGPEWKKVGRRITVNLDDDSKIEDIYIFPRMGKDSYIVHFHLM